MTKLFAKTLQDMSTLQIANGRDKHINGCHHHHQYIKPPKSSQDGDGVKRREGPKLRPLHRGHDFIKINQLIDLSDKPIRLTRDEICWSRVRANGSNCICCCCNNTITLITTDESYVLDHIPLDNNKTGQANSSLKYLALANDDQLAVIDLIESNPCNPVGSKSIVNLGQGHHHHHQLNRDTRSKRRLVDLAAIGLSMREILFWRWIDESTLALVSNEATLYTCEVDQTQINHPALTALSKSPTQLLSLEKVCNILPDLGGLCQITNVQRDASTNLYAISGLCLHQPATARDYTVKSAANNRSATTPTTTPHSPSTGKSNQINNNQLHNDFMLTKLRRNSNSVPGRLSNINDEQQQQQQPTLTGSIKSENFFSIESLRRATRISQLNSFANRSTTHSSHQQATPATVSQNDDEDIRGLTQIYCRLRNCSQLIQAHAVAFTTTTTNEQQQRGQGVSVVEPDVGEELLNESVSWTTLVAANLINNKLKVYFIGMATASELSTSGQNTSRCIEFNSHHEDGKMDFPTSLVCSKLDSNNEKTHAAMIITKFGHMIVCSIAQGTILFNVQIANDIISGAVLDDKSRGAMIICRNGQVLLVRVRVDKFCQLLDETRTNRHSAAPYYLSASNADNITKKTKSTSGDCDGGSNGLAGACKSSSSSSSASIDQRQADSESFTDMGVEVIISTKL